MQRNKMNRFWLWFLLSVPLTRLPAQVIATYEWIHFYSDSSTVNSHPIAPGTKISVITEKGYLCGEVLVKTDGQYGFLPVYRDDATSTLIDGANPGEILLFYLFGQTTPPGFNLPVWTVNGAVLKWDLHVQVPEGPRLRIDPVTLNFPATAIGQIDTVELQLCNIGTEVLQILERVCLPDPNFWLDIAPLTLPAGVSVQVPVVFQPTVGHGLAKTEFTLTTNTPEPSYARVRLQGEIITDIVPGRAWITVTGSCMLDGIPAPSGTFVDVYDLQGVHCGSGQVGSTGQFGPLRIFADDPSTDIDEGAEPGELLLFSVHGYPARTLGQTPVIWTAAGQQLQIELAAVANFPPHQRHKLTDLMILEDATPVFVGRLDSIFIDRDCDALVFEVTSDQPLVQVIVNHRNELWLSLAPEQSGKSRIAVLVHDQHTIAVDSFWVRVLPVNDPPQIIDLVTEYTVINTDTLRINLKSHARDIDSPADRLYWSVVSLTPALHALMESESSALFWAPGYAGIARAVLTVTDDSLASASDTLTIAFQQPTGVMNTSADLPNRYFLETAFPNPFNPTTTLRYQLPQAADVEIKIYDLRARQVGHWLLRCQPPGGHQLIIDLSNEPSGVYFLRFQANDWVQRQRLVLLK